MKKKVLIQSLFVLLALAAMVTGAFGEPNQPIADPIGSCGYMPWVASPPYYWSDVAMSYSQCINTGLPNLIAFAHAHCPWCVLTETSCRPAKYCPH